MGAASLAERRRTEVTWLDKIYAARVGWPVVSEKRNEDPGYGAYGVVDAAGRRRPRRLFLSPFSLVLCFLHGKSLASSAASLLSAAWEKYMVDVGY
jgi:hypothetical protein